MIAQIVSDTFKLIGHTWKSGSSFITPTEEDVEEVLDAAAAVLYTKGPEHRFESGGLIIDRADTGYDVYVYVGNYR